MTGITIIGAFLHVAKGSVEVLAVGRLSAFGAGWAYRTPFRGLRVTVPIGSPGHFGPGNFDCRVQDLDDCR